MSELLPVEGGANQAYRWAVLAVSVVAQATFLDAVFQGLPVLGPVLRSAYGLSLGQLGLCEDRQVKNANVALVHGNGGVLSSQVTAVLGTGSTL